MYLTYKYKEFIDKILILSKIFSFLKRKDQLNMPYK